jgi:hypothetical protein
VLLSDAVSGHDASDFHGGTARITILDGDGTLDVRIGPLVEGASERILDLPGGTSLRKLATKVEITPADGGGELLRVVIEP